MDFLLVTIGSLIAAIGFNAMFLPNHIVAGGMSGLAVALEKLCSWQPDYFLYGSNIPLLILSWVFLGKENFAKTLYGSWIFPVFITITKQIGSFTDNQLLGAIFGGVIVGFGIGLVYYGDSSTGGTGVLVQIIGKFTPISLGAAIILTDGMVVLTGLIAFDHETVMYSLIALFIVSRVVDFVAMGLNNAKNVMIISQKSEEVQQYLMDEISRGVTKLRVTGGFGNEEKEMLMCVVDGGEYPVLQRNILAIDPEAFVIVMPASEVLGRGFSLWKHYVHEDHVGALRK
ncbi:Uncharacterized membrane-anchored protein YitT, contains DUF161 and DUF2179 domains [Pilibacter termitis]|uniref:Uncharacterized membrane-anchored protein YitT, contains DUF161 and DUF2179 domains n=1 Tax=Pilibacter termitis TaxID=263852 RepID=A0A1T4LL85_9ENTE|nr:YitT family protein [Pilibacter termitis]SJZ55234.1 Uncharacterized membrane-anchored protein YitT, contains DUF161 and DUF2179 domains [Pilibacter termitis]